MDNSRGPVGLVAGNRLDDFATFDRLTPALRERLRMSPQNIRSGALLDVIRRYGFDEREALLWLEQRDDEITKQNCRELFGPDHPQLSEPYKPVVKMRSVRHAWDRGRH